MCSIILNNTSPLENSISLNKRNPSIYKQLACHVKSNSRLLAASSISTKNWCQTPSLELRVFFAVHVQYMSVVLTTFPFLFRQCLAELPGSELGQGGLEAG